MLDHISILVRDAAKSRDFYQAALAPLGYTVVMEFTRAQVPNLLLQPLVENAIKHGIANRVAGGTVRVAGACYNGTLRLSVYNDGPTFPTDWQATNTGVGIGNLRTRLQILHGNECGLQLRCADPSGVEVLVTLPFREA